MHNIRTRTCPAGSGNSIDCCKKRAGFKLILATTNSTVYKFFRSGLACLGPELLNIGQYDSQNKAGFKLMLATTNSMYIKH